jgi:hypothetical protein
MKQSAGKRSIVQPWTSFSLEAVLVLNWLRVLLLTENQAAFYMGSVWRVITTGLAIVLIVAVAAILITPDPSDDVDGLLHRHGSVQLGSVSLVSAIGAHALSPGFRRSEPRPAPNHLTSPDVLTLICALLC